MEPDVTLITFTARGARYLNPIPCSLLCRLMVYSRVTTSPMVDPFFSFFGDILSSAKHNMVNNLVSQQFFQ